ncbi:aspartate aminotransferase family protein [Funiculus sociatus GB2-M2]|uniref:pyridoxal phosphate-dependent decarboxylase family protein n=1 Tax=Cyanophyceae TaxID=3028117 RepID=UPI001F54A290|nr:aspartate aminotransferase family protein [Trichocoleus sp. FACHB-90]
MVNLYQMDEEQKTGDSSSQNPFDTCFVTNSANSIAAYQEAIATAQQVIIDCFASSTQPYSGAKPEELAAALAAIELCPEFSQDLPKILKKVGETVVKNSVVVSHPTCIAHLHCPPLTAALAAEVLISATNQSMDSWDQSPAATFLEQQVVNWLCNLFAYDAAADGVFTSGGTQSNFMGLLLARDRYAQKHLNWSIQQQGLPPEASRFRILCSVAAHFTIRQAAALLGLGEQAVVTVETDANYRQSPAALERQLKELQQQELLPIALVGTVGTTDFGSIDPLPEIAACAKKQGLWLHIDAAYGGALVLSDRHRHKLVGIEEADSIAVDFHKLFYQPISCGAFLLKNRSHFDLIKLHTDYLNPETNIEQGILDLVTKSVQTTRRFDALKLFVSLHTLGRRQLAEIIETTINLAEKTAQLIDAEPVLELANYPTINAVVFRYIPRQTPPETHSVTYANQINSQIRMSLLRTGEAVLAQTRIAERIYLKFTLLNPHTTTAHITQILNTIKHLGKQLELLPL